MADPGHDNDFPDLSSFDDESSVISVSAAIRPDWTTDFPIDRNKGGQVGGKEASKGANQSFKQ